MLLWFSKTPDDADEVVYVVIEPKTGRPVYAGANLQQTRLIKELFDRRSGRGHRVAKYVLASRAVPLEERGGA